MSELPLPPEKLRYPRGLDFVTGGEAVFDQLVGFGGLKPEDRVLDAGCGIGRVARHLVDYLTGSYEGFDIVPPAVEWCQDEITPRHPNFRFQVAKANIRNGKYNPNGAVSAAQYRWPYEDTSFDFVFLASVFTHLLPSDVENYVQQAARVLKPGGRLLATYFLLNKESVKLMEHEGSRFNFKKRIAPGCRTTRPNRPEAAIAYAERRVRDLYAESGLTLLGVRYGGWCRPRADYHQDIVVAIKT